MRVPYGIVRYQGDQDRVVPFDDHNRRWIFDVIEEIRTAREEGNQHRSHNKPARCIGCGFRRSVPGGLVIESSGRCSPDRPSQIHPLAAMFACKGFNAN